jgi:hypothetical protein
MAEDAPNAAAKWSQPATPKGSADAASAAVASTKAMEALLPRLNMWLQL